MDRQLLTSTSLTGLRPRGAGGRRVHDSWDQIDAYLRQALGADYADLFAEPISGSGGDIFWYGAYEGEPKAFSALSEEEQNSLKETVRERFETIEAHIKGLAESPREEEQRLAAVLESALCVPEYREGRDFLYSVEGNPVLINWGTRDDVADPKTGVLAEFLTTKRAAAPIPPPVPPVPPAAVFPWWNFLWLLFAALVGANLYLLLAACAINDPLGLRQAGILGNYCPAFLLLEDENQEPLEDERARTDALRHELARLEDSLFRAEPCRFPPPPPPPAPAPEPPPEPEPEPAPEPPPPPPPPPPEPPPPPDPCEEVGVVCEDGDVTITLRWDTPDDLDLMIVCPDGDRVKYSSKEACGGRLDVDNRAQNPNDPGAENIYFEEGLPEPGTYRIEVENFADRTPGRSTPYRVIIRDKEGNVVEKEGRIEGDHKVDVIDTLERR